MHFLKTTHEICSNNDIATKYKILEQGRKNIFRPINEKEYYQ